MIRFWTWTVTLFCGASFGGWSNVAADEKPIAESWDTKDAMRKVAAGFRGTPGVVIHVGDSITYSNPYGQWARSGQGQTDDDKAILKWMHTGRDNDTDGWWLARFDHPAGGRSYTACGGIRMNELLAGGKRQMPSLAQILEKYKPQAVVLMCGTNDASANRPEPDFRRDAERAVDLILAQHAVCILSTIPPHPGRPELAQSYNRALRDIAQKRRLPLIDFEREILARRPNDWNGTLLGKDDVHPTAARAGVSANSAPTAANLEESGYLLRGWLSVQKIAEVKRTIFDAVKPPASSEKSPSGKKPIGQKPAADPSLKKPVAETPSSKRLSPPRGTPIRLPVTRDTRVSSYPGEETFSPGGASQLKLKSYQEFAIVDFDPASLRGRVITGGELHVRLPDGYKERLRRITVSSLASEWTEGRESSGAAPGASSFKWRQNPNVPWAEPSSDLTAVTLGLGGTIWHSAEATDPTPERWQVIPVDARVLAARVAGLSFGCVVFDDTGSEWKREGPNGEKFVVNDFPNRYFMSRDSNRSSAPYFVIYVEGEDQTPPAAVTDGKAEPSRSRRDEVRVSWSTPADKNSGAEGRENKADARVLGFFVESNGKRLPQYFIPAAKKQGERVIMLLPAGALASEAIESKLPGKRSLEIRAVDLAGNIGPAAHVDLPRIETPLQIPWPKTPAPSTGKGPLPRLGKAEIAIIDTLDKINPLTGVLVAHGAATTPEESAKYLVANHLWSADGKVVRLSAARGEIVSFQVIVLGPVDGLRPTLLWEAKEPITVDFSRLRHVSTKAGFVPDPLIPLEAEGLHVPARDEKIANQRAGSLLVELVVPVNAESGTHHGLLKLETPDAGTGEKSRLDLAIELDVHKFALPDTLSFLPEMNCYGLPANELAYFRLAHRNRTVLNRVPYSQRGLMDDGAAPNWDGNTLDFSAWDKRFGGLLDGSAFADLPRAGVPIECFYLPMHENWPTPIAPNYNGSYWADEAFPASYFAAFVSATTQFAMHCHERRWHRTRFHGFLNNKNNFKRNGWSRGSSPWILDEPAHYQDFFALLVYGEAFHQGARLAGELGSRAKFVYRCDISRPQWQRDVLDGLLDYNVISSGAFREYRHLVLNRKELHPQEVIVYGSANDPASSNVQGAAWCVDAWSLGADGVLPWQTVGTAADWQTGSTTCLFYPGETIGRRDPVPSIRLKSYLRGQQDVEYLTLLAKKARLTQLELGASLRSLLPIKGERRGTGYTADEDAGVMDYGKLTPLELWQLRTRVAHLLN